MIHLTTSQVWKGNKRRVLKNWRLPFIREKYGFRLAAYATAWEDRYMDPRWFNVDLAAGTIARYIYSHATEGQS